MAKVLNAKNWIECIYAKIVGILNILMEIIYVILNSGRYGSKIKELQSEVMMLSYMIHMNPAEQGEAAPELSLQDPIPLEHLYTRNLKCILSLEKF